MRQKVRIGPECGGRIDRDRRGRFAGVRGPGRLLTRLACRASILLAMSCTAVIIGRMAQDLALLYVTSPRWAEPSGRAAALLGYLLVGMLAWATLRLIVAAEDWGTIWVESPRFSPPVDRRLLDDPATDCPRTPGLESIACSSEDADFWAILERSRVVAYMKDRRGRYVRVNRQWANLFDPENRGIVGRDDFAIFPPELATAFARNDRMVMDAGITIELEEVAPHPDGPHTYLSIKVPLFDIKGNACGICGISSDITERKELERRLADQLELARAANAELGRRGEELAEANARLAELATTDGLTSLMNRRHFDEVIEAGVETAFRDGTPLSVLMLDLDGFKSYNDAFGHPAGDRVLQKVASILRDHVRACDEVARYGGEEFIAMLPETDEMASRLVAERLRAAIEDWRWPDRSLTASIGVATFSYGLGDSQALIDRADRALYRSKAAGRNRITHHDDLPRYASSMGIGSS